MYSYFEWMTDRVGPGATIIITGCAMALLATFLGLWLAKPFSTKCPSCGGQLLQLGYMDSARNWCPRCNP